MKLTVEYDPMTGHVCKDGEAQGWVDDIIHHALYKMGDEQNPVVVVASGLLVDYFRVRLAEGIIKKDQIEFKFQGKVLEHNEYSQLRHWPKGYCDTAIEPVERLLTLQSKAWKKKKEERDARRNKV